MPVEMLGERTLITIDMQTGQQFNLPFIFHPGGDGRDTRVVGSPTDSRQEGGIGAWFHDLAGIPVVHLDISGASSSR